jgi:hypothetical protein
LTIPPDFVVNLKRYVKDFMKNIKALEIRNGKEGAEFVSISSPVIGPSLQALFTFIGEGCAGVSAWTD